MTDLVFPAFLWPPKNLFPLGFLETLPRTVERMAAEDRICLEQISVGQKSFLTWSHHWQPSWANPYSHFLVQYAFGISAAAPSSQLSTSHGKFVLASYSSP